MIQNYYPLDFEAQYECTNPFIQKSRKKWYKSPRSTRTSYSISSHNPSPPSKTNSKTYSTPSRRLTCSSKNNVLSLPYSHLLSVRLGATDGLTTQTAPRNVPIMRRRTQKASTVWILRRTILQEVLQQEQSNPFRIKIIKALLWAMPLEIRKAVRQCSKLQLILVILRRKGKAGERHELREK